MVAAYHGSYQVIEILLCANADVNTCVTAGEVGHISLTLLYIYMWLEQAAYQ